MWQTSSVLVQILYWPGFRWSPRTIGLCCVTPWTVAQMVGLWHNHWTLESYIYIFWFHFLICITGNYRSADLRFFKSSCISACRLSTLMWSVYTGRPTWSPTAWASSVLSWERNSLNCPKPDRHSRGWLLVQINETHTLIIHSVQINETHTLIIHAVLVCVDDGNNHALKILGIP